MQRRDFLLAGSAAMLMSTPLIAQTRRDAVDVVVIGSGGAGLAGAITTADAGASVLVLEKMPIIGGNTEIAAGGMNAAGTRLQAELGIADDWHRMYEDTMTGGYGRNDPELVLIMTKGSAGAIDWLERLGAKFAQHLTLTGGQSEKRTYLPEDEGSFGVYITRVVLDAAVARKVAIRRDSKVVEILQRPDGGVRGVVVQDRRGDLYTVEAKAIIIASGGYGASPEKMAEYKPEYAKFNTTNQPGATGDALEFASKTGADFFDLDQVQIHPTQAVGAKTLISEDLRSDGAILVNRDGKRFINELTTRDRVSQAELAQKGQSAFVVFDQTVRQSHKLIEGYFTLELVKQGDTLASLAANAGVDPANLAKTVTAYNGYVAAKKDADFGRVTMARQITAPPYYAIEVKPGIHFTMGGIRINGRTQVMSKLGDPIPGLFAAGEVTGGVHGANRLGGNSMTSLFVFGPIAGREAVAYIKT